MVLIQSVYGVDTSQTWIKENDPAHPMHWTTSITGEINFVYTVKRGKENFSARTCSTGQMLSLTPTEAYIQALKNALEAKTIRPKTQLVTIEPPPLQKTSKRVKEIADVKMDADDRETSPRQLKSFFQKRMDIMMDKTDKHFERIEDKQSEEQSTDKPSNTKTQQDTINMLIVRNEKLARQIEE
ncbi:hypothetical protein O181_006304 [Austropuccinia psidii MF-1]|uniref:Uncharacterized protein n=1 Tax=Austropuccinia psidii MF-1 TaxID=1389203 RepID=A0A9Q3BJ36_9BASI|nr:hypothetical protein [Austropuccinia psidii MF-1]